jgi:hypothetical protein
MTATGDTAAGTRPALDPLTASAVTIAWVIFANKPFYPLYVWWFVGNGATAALGTLIAAPLFLAIPFLARRSPLLARAALPIIGAIDTLWETWLFGAASGTELFLAACLLLAAVSFYAHEIWWQRGVAVAIFLAFFAAHGRLGGPHYPWSPDELAKLLEINIFAVASLLTFIALRYAGRRADHG